MTVWASLWPIVCLDCVVAFDTLALPPLSLQALPIFLDKLVSPVLAIILSVTAVLTFGERVHCTHCSHSIMSSSLHFLSPTSCAQKQHVSGGHSMLHLTTPSAAHLQAAYKQPPLLHPHMSTGGL